MDRKSFNTNLEDSSSSRRSVTGRTVISNSWVSSKTKTWRTVFPHFLQTVKYLKISSSSSSAGLYVFNNNGYDMIEKTSSFIHIMCTLDKTLKLKRILGILFVLNSFTCLTSNFHTQL